MPVFIVVYSWLGVQSVARALPFGLALGVSRRTYFLGAASLAAALAAGYGLVLGSQAVERATGGWGMNMGYFRVPYILDGSWYLSWLTASVTFLLMFAYGMWYGLVYRRLGMTGTLIFGAAQLSVAGAGRGRRDLGARLARLGHFFATISAAGVTAVLAVAGGRPAGRRLRHHPPPGRVTRTTRTTRTSRTTRPTEPDVQHAWRARARPASRDLGDEPDEVFSSPDRSCRSGRAGRRGAGRRLREQQQEQPEYGELLRQARGRLPAGQRAGRGAQSGRRAGLDAAGRQPGRTPAMWPARSAAPNVSTLGVAWCVPVRGVQSAL